MNWVKENKFLTGYIAVMLIGVGALGYEVYAASSANDEASDNYTKQATEYNRLRHLVPFPSRPNLEAYDQQKKEAADVIDAFEADLAKKAFPLEPMTPSGFQDKLKASVSEVRTKAEAAGVTLPEKFYLAFEKYESTPPSTEAAAPLGRELKSIQWVLERFLSQPTGKVEKIVDLKRADLPEEGSGRSGQKGGGSGKGGPAGAARGGTGIPGGNINDRRGLVKYFGFDIAVLCKPEGLRNTLKEITAANAPQFYVLRNIKIANSQPKPPSRAGDPTQTEKDKDTVKYIVGTESIEVTAHFEMVDFSSPGEKVASEVSPSGSSSSSPKSNPVRR